MQAISIDLTGFSWPELMLLVHHLQYAGNRLQQEMDLLRHTQHRRFLKKRAEVQPQNLLLSHWAGLIRDRRYFTFLARAVETAINDRAGLFLFPDGAPPPLDLAGLRIRDNRPFREFLKREQRRAHLAMAYLQRETFDQQLTQDLLLALDVESRFFSRLLARLELLCPPTLTPSRPDEDRIPLLFVSLPRPLMRSGRPAFQQPASR
jgi:hypothetical protein